MKKILALLLCAVLLGSYVLPAFASAAFSFTLATETAMLQRGQEVKIKVRATGSGPVDAFGVLLRFDEKVFEISGGSNACGEVYAGVKDSNGDPVLAVCDFDKEKGGLATSFQTAQTLSNVEVGYITLKVRADAPLGDTTCTGETAAQAGGAAVPSSCNTVTFTVACEHSWSAWTKTSATKHSRTCPKCDATETADHSFGQWEQVKAATPAGKGQEKRSCKSCTYSETRDIAYKGNGIVLTGDLSKETTVYIEGLPYAVQTDGAVRYVELPKAGDTILVTYTFHAGDGKDVHTQYPTGMKVYKVSGGKVTHIPELDNLLQYSGSSIRITGNKGIRMITSLDKTKKAALTGKGLAGYTLEEYGTVLSFAKEIAAGDGLVLGRSFARSNYAYKKGVADPVFATTDKLVQYTNVLVGFSLDQCKEDIAMRPYIILKDAKGQKITLYGGTIYRSIGYIAYQNRTVFTPKTASYNYVWEIIHHVFGKQYDKDYKG